MQISPILSKLTEVYTSSRDLASKSLARHLTSESAMTSAAETVRADLGVVHGFIPFTVTSADEISSRRLDRKIVLQLSARIQSTPENRMKIALSEAIRGIGSAKALHSTEGWARMGLDTAAIAAALAAAGFSIPIVGCAAGASTAVCAKAVATSDTVLSPDHMLISTIAAKAAHVAYRYFQSPPSTPDELLRQFARHESIRSAGLETAGKSPDVLMRDMKAAFIQKALSRFERNSSMFSLACTEIIGGIFGAIFDRSLATNDLESLVYFYGDSSQGLISSIETSLKELTNYYYSILASPLLFPILLREPTNILFMPQEDEDSFDRLINQLGPRLRFLTGSASRKEELSRLHLQIESLMDIFGDLSFTQETASGAGATSYSFSTLLREIDQKTAALDHVKKADLLTRIDCLSLDGITGHISTLQSKRNNPAAIRSSVCQEAETFAQTYEENLKAITAQFDVLDSSSKLDETARRFREAQAQRVALLSQLRELISATRPGYLERGLGVLGFGRSGASDTGRAPALSVSSESTSTPSPIKASHNPLTLIGVLRSLQGLIQRKETLAPAKSEALAAAAMASEPITEEEEFSLEKAEDITALIRFLNAKLPIVTALEEPRRKLLVKLLKEVEALHSQLSNPILLKSAPSSLILEEQMMVRIKSLKRAIEEAA